MKYEAGYDLKVRIVISILFGTIVLFFSVPILKTIWTTKSSLIAFKGTLENCNTYATTVESTSRYGGKTKSYRTQLIFYLVEVKKKFVLSENTGNKYKSNELENLKAKLKSARSVTVWIKKDEKHYWQPKVFQIEADGQVLVDFETVRNVDRPVAGVIILIGIICIMLPVHLLNKFSNKSSENKKVTQVEMGLQEIK